MNDETTSLSPAEPATSRPAPPPIRSKKQMTANAIAGERNAREGWKLVLTAARAAWNKVPPEDLTKVNGNRHVLAGLVQLRYHTSREDADEQVRRFFDEHPVSAAVGTPAVRA